MNWLDIFIVLFLLASLIRGMEVGFVRQFFSTSGFFGGLFLGAWIENQIIQQLHSPATKAVIVLIIVLGCGLIFMTAGEYIGLRIKFKLRESKFAEKIDRVFGSALAGITLLLAVWMGAAIFSNIPDPGWQRQIRSSRVIAALNNDLPSAPSLLSRLGRLLDPNGFPQVFVGLEPELPTDTPLPDLGELNPAIERVRASVVKIEGAGCGGIVEGSGFVADNDLVITNAHVVAGVSKPFIVDQAGQHDAKVVWFDQNLDLAVLRSSNLTGAPLALYEQMSENGTNSAVLGYPESRGFTAEPAVILDTFAASGRNIYNQGDVTRKVYSVKATVEQGNSGGPLINKDGLVIGVLFAKSAHYDQVGYALTADQVAPGLAKAAKNNKAVDSGTCTE